MLLDHALEQLAARTTRGTYRYMVENMFQSRSMHAAVSGYDSLKTTISHPNDIAMAAQKIAILRDSHSLALRTQRVERGDSVYRPRNARKSLSEPTRRAASKRHG